MSFVSFVSQNYFVGKTFFVFFWDKTFWSDRADFFTGEEKRYFFKEQQIFVSTDTPNCWNWPQSSSLAFTFVLPNAQSNCYIILRRKKVQLLSLLHNKSIEWNDSLSLPNNQDEIFATVSSKKIKREFW